MVKAADDVLDPKLAMMVLSMLLALARSRMRVAAVPADDAVTEGISVSQKAVAF
jgi:hypothetical protein